MGIHLPGAHRCRRGTPDFRIVPGETHTNLIFDIAAPFELTMTSADLRAKAADEIHKRNDHLFAVITVDRV